jgi:hypothetical protein
MAGTASGYILDGGMEDHHMEVPKPLGRLKIGWKLMYIQVLITYIARMERLTKTRAITRLNVRYRNTTERSRDLMGVDKL